jgi:hypothetical protein
MERTIEPDPQDKWQQDQRSRQVAHERHDVGIEMLRRNQREDVEQREQQARYADPEDAAQVWRQRKPAGDEGGHAATMS